MVLRKKAIKGQVLRSEQRVKHSSYPFVVKKRSFSFSSHLLISAAVVAVLLSLLGYLGTDIWLASTQWLIIAGVLAGFGIYTKLESN